MIERRFIMSDTNTEVTKLISECLEGKRPEYIIADMSELDKEIRDMVLNELPWFLDSAKLALNKRVTNLFVQYSKISYEDARYFNIRICGLKLEINEYIHRIQNILIYTTEPTSRIIQDIMLFIDMIDNQYEYIENEFVKLYCN